MYNVFSLFKSRLESHTELFLLYTHTYMYAQACVRTYVGVYDLNYFSSFIIFIL